jgi:hypothetical protein
MRSAKLHHRSGQRAGALAYVALALVCGLAASGCRTKGDGWKFASWDVRRAVGLKKGPAEPKTPQRLVATWTDTVLNTAGQPSKRGFGGRLVFFERASQDPVRVEGQLVVYAFDETDREPHETHPTRRYVFPAEDFARMESDSTLGSSYSVFLPWDEVGGPPKKISLITRFEPAKGAIVLGEQTRHYLPGLGVDGKTTTQFAETTTKSETSDVQLAGFNGAATEQTGAIGSTPSEIAGKPRLKMSTATIPLPKQRSALNAAPSSPAPIH